MAQRGHTAKMSLGDLAKGAYERIFKHTRPKFKGRQVLRYGPPAKAHDSVNVESVACAINPCQADEWNAKYGHLGVKWDKRDGFAHFKDRPSKLRVLKALNLFDRDEVRG